MSDWVDWRGTPIEIGSIVVYPGRHGSSMWMMEGEVVERYTKLSYRDTVIRVLRVRRTRGHWGVSEGISTLTSVDRVTVVH